MTKQEKIAALATAMTQSKRDDGTEFYHFTDAAPEELKRIYLEHYEVRDIDYETFNRACDIVAEAYESYDGKDADKLEGDIYELASDSASVYNDDRIGYINVWNQDEIAENVRDMHVDIATAAAIWYDKQIEQAAIIIKDWIESK